MTAKIFISWSSPDAGQVGPLVGRLRAAGLDLWEYSEDMGAGAQIHGEILEAIDQVRMAIICFSDKTADRQWIRDEAAWIFQTWWKGKEELQYVVPVWVGPHPKNKIPKLLDDTQFPVQDVSDGSEASLTSLVLKIFKKLGREAPVVIPVALFAMTRKQCTALLAKKETAAELSKMCRAAGMTEPPPITQALCTRYGEKADDLKPFDAKTPLREIVEEVVKAANGVRAAARPPKRPIWLRWMQDELVKPGAANVGEARSRWATGSSLLIVDSVSSYHQDIRAQLMNLPEPKQPERAAILWLPPYTQHTATLEAVLGPAAGVVARLGDAFADWRDELPARAMMFDTATPASTRRWLRDAFLGVEDDQEPVSSKRSVMEEKLGTGFSIGQAFQAAKGRKK